MICNATLQKLYTLDGGFSVMIRSAHSYLLVYFVDYRFEYHLGSFPSHFTDNIEGKKFLLIIMPTAMHPP